MKISIQPEEVFRYAAASALAKEPFWEERVQEAIALTEAHMSPRFCYRCFSIKPEETGVALQGAALFLPGQDIKKHLKGAKGCYLLAATLGTDMETLLRRTMATDMALGILLDACADAVIESLCDAVCDEIRSKLPCGKHCTTRYSPGYGDFPLAVQAAFLAVLDAPRKIGLCVSPNLILLPRKSVTAVVGITETETKYDTRGCAHCSNRSTCAYKNA